jgi:hypothetical protein
MPTGSGIKAYGAYSMDFFVLFVCFVVDIKSI